MNCAKHGRSSPNSSARFRYASAAAILATADAFDFVVLTKRMIDRRLRFARPLPRSAQAQVKGQIR